MTRVIPVVETKTHEEAQAYWNYFNQLPKGVQHRLRPDIFESHQKHKKNYKKLESTVTRGQSARVTCAREASNHAGLIGSPVINKGVVNEEIPSLIAKEKFEIQAINHKGKTTLIRTPLRDKGYNDTHAFIDYLNITIPLDSVEWILPSGHQALSPENIANCISTKLNHIFGYGCNRKLDGKYNFYEHTWNLGDDGHGMLSLGGNRDTLLIIIKGQGLLAAQEGWELRAYKWLKTIAGARITRVDLAHDSFRSQVSVDDYLNMYRAGMFTNSYTEPNVECKGNWEKPNGKGRSLYIGSRQSGKLLRIYEKGLQLANGYHELYPKWLRIELELHNRDREIPLDCLLHPGQYLAGAYPALASLFRVQERIQLIQKQSKSNVKRCIEIARHQFGKHIWATIQLYGIEKAFEMLTKGKEQVPESMDFRDYLSLGRQLHDLPVPVMTLEEISI